MGEYTHMGSKNNSLGEKPTQEQVILTSVEKQITAEYPPTYLWCGEMTGGIIYTMTYPGAVIMVLTDRSA